MENKINLEEILRKHTSVEWEGISPKELILKAMLDFGKQLLELAAENAEMILLVDEENDIIEEASINKQSILDTINQVE